MNNYPFRLLTAGYVLAGLCAVAVQMTIGSVLLSLLVFWLGGAALVLTLGAAPLLSRPFRQDATTDVEADLARWEADRLADARAALRDEIRAAG